LWGWGGGTFDGAGCGCWRPLVGFARRILGVCDLIGWKDLGYLVDGLVVTRLDSSARVDESLGHNER
jgi:hypothetical protein